MPLTLPSHAAAILPLTRPWARALPPSALVAGTAAPDIGYATGWGAGLAHTPQGLVLVALPLGFLLWLWAEVLLLPLLRRVLPTARGVAWARRFQTRGLPRSAREWGFAALAVLIGAATHLVWDGFTHDTLAPARWLYPHVAPAWLGGFTLAEALQHLSTVVGFVLVARVWARASATLPPCRTVVGTREFRIVLLVVLAAAALQAFRELRWLHPSTPAFSYVWIGFWAGVRASFVALTLLGLVARWRDRAGPPLTISAGRVPPAGSRSASPPRPSAPPPPAPPRPASGHPAQT